jgi:hypothetical protein
MLLPGCREVRWIFGSEILPHLPRRRDAVMSCRMRRSMIERKIMGLQVDC